MPAGRLMQQGARDPLGVRYVILGSHLGARMLQRRWRRSQLARVQAAGTFLAASASSAGWAELCDELAARDAYGDACENVVKDAHGVFDLYLTCAEIAKDHVADAQDLRRHSA